MLKTAILIAWFGAAVLAGAAYAADPLSRRIDAAIEAEAGTIAAAPLADDAEFLRRVYLDLIGTIPTPGEARTFIQETASDKRTKLIDRLLKDDRFAAHWAEAMTIMLMERRLPPDKPEIEQFEAYLRDAFSAGKPLDRVVAELLSPDADDEKTRASGIFLAKRLENYGQNPVDLPGLTRDVGRLFLGIDLKCAQCHNHLTVKEWKQSDYQGLFAFVGHTYLRKDVKFPAVGEKLVDKKLDYESVFSGNKSQIGPRLPDMEEVSIPMYEPGQEWITPPDKKTRALGVPKFSPLKVLAEQLPAADNPLFTRNLANRLWYLMAGRGIVHPLDMHHKDNPPSNPALLDLLSAELVASKFDLKTMVRQIALSEAYQRSSRMADESAKLPAAGTFRVAQLKRLSAEQLLRASLVATGEWESVSKRQPAAKIASTEAIDPTADVNPDADESSAKAPAGSLPTLKELRKAFVAAFAAPPGEPEVEFSPTVASALFVMNDDSTLPWLTRRDGNLIDRLAKVDDPAQVAEELYLSVLTRFPTDDERAEAVGHLKDAKAKDRAIGELVWALLASTEFAVNH